MKFINDSISDIDMLGYEPYLKAFEYIIKGENELMDLPIVFGIHGKWGIGKSTFMQLIKNRLDKYEKFYTININPWEFATSNYNFISIFLAELFKTIKDDLTWDERGEGDKIINFFKSMIKPLKLSVDVPYGFNHIKAEYDFDKLNFAMKKNLVERYIDENYEIKNTIHDILNYELFNRKKLVVFIDDLDRCSSYKVMEVIESIKLILNSENCIFFLGCDKGYLEKALSIQYKDFIAYGENEENQYFKKFADEYLEKIIQIPFSIPPINKASLENYVRGLLEKGDPTSKDNIAQKSETNIVKKNERSLYTDFKKKFNSSMFSNLVIEIKLNPRRIKRTLNLLFINYLFMIFKIGEDNVKEEDLDLLILINIIRDEFADFYKEYFLSVVQCKKAFKIFHDYYMRNDEDSIENIEKEDDESKDGDVIFENDQINILFEIFFREEKIKRAAKLDILLDNIENILSSSHTATSESYIENDWGEIGEIKSSTGTGKRVKNFLDRVTNKQQIDFLLWFFNDIYCEDKYYLGININVQVYKKRGVMDCKKNFLYKFEYDKGVLSIKFENGRYRSNLSNLDMIKDFKYFNDKKKELKITSEINDVDFKLLKEKFYEINLEN